MLGKKIHPEQLNGRSNAEGIKPLQGFELETSGSDTMLQWVY